MNKVSTRAILLDRDGVLDHDRVDYVKNADELVMIDGVPEAVAALGDAGYAVLVVTNQSCVGKGILPMAGVRAIHELIQRNLGAAGGRVDAFYICPHAPDDGCDCRKPAPGMMLQAQEDWGFDPAETWLVGDATRDILAGQAAGCRTALVRTGKGETSATELPDTPLYDDLPHFVRWLLAEDDL
jgi:D-glycero-D-manno-heptose 1,7-bisphosphate phosphatase